MKTRNTGITYLHTGKEEEEIEKRDRVSAAVDRISEKLQQEGVYQPPALRIARRAHEAGLDPASVVALHRAHRRELQALGKSPEEGVRIATWRMAHLPLRAPDPSAPSGRSGQGGTAPSGSGNFARYGRTAPPRNPIATEFRARLSASPTGSGEGARAIGPAHRPSSSHSSLQDQWAGIQRELELGLSRPVYDQHLRGARLVELADGRCTISVRSPSSLAWLEHQLKGRVESVLAYQLGRPVKPTFVCEGA